MFETVIVVMGSIVVVSAVIVLIVKLSRKSDFTTDYEIEFEERNIKGKQFVSRFEMDYFELRNHND